MSSSDIAVRVRSLSKAYTIAHNTQKHTTAAEALVHRLKNPFARQEKEMFWALKDIDFDIDKGDVVGIIGHNGAGKSTLLKILSRITHPTTGHVDLYGRVGSLLEVGTGFHPELTGYENIYLNGAILGMSKREIAKQFDSIVDFSGTDQFIDTPVKRYSSGMYVRLAFAVAAHLNPEILIVDEVLAVGDGEFQKKCLGKMKDVAANGRTVLFVSHQLSAVAKLCEKAMVLRSGRVEHFGGVQEALELYICAGQNNKYSADPQRREGSGELRFDTVSCSKEYYECAEEKVIQFSVQQYKPYQDSYYISCHVLDAQGAIILHMDSRLTGDWFKKGSSGKGRIVIKTPWLKPGNYRVDMFICKTGIIDKYEFATDMNVAPILPYAATSEAMAGMYGAVLTNYLYEIDMFVETPSDEVKSDC